MKRNVIFLVAVLCVASSVCVQAISVSSALQALRSKLVGLVGALDPLIDFLKKYPNACKGKGESVLTIKKTDDLQKIVTLDLSFNQLTKIPDLSKLTSLQQLYLSYNQLTKIPGLRALTKLQWLILSKNTLTKEANEANEAIEKQVKKINQSREEGKKLKVTWE